MSAPKPFKAWSDSMYLRCLNGLGAHGDYKYPELSKQFLKQKIIDSSRQLTTIMTTSQFLGYIKATVERPTFKIRVSVDKCRGVEE